MTCPQSQSWCKAEMGLETGSTHFQSSVLFPFYHPDTMNTALESHLQEKDTRIYIFVIPTSQETVLKFTTPPDTRSFCIQQSITGWCLCWVYGKTSLKADGLDATFSSLICSLTFFFFFSRNNVSSFTSGPPSGSLQRSLDGEVKPCFWIFSLQHLLGFVNSLMSTPMMNKSLNVWHISKHFFPVKVLLASG